MPAGHWTDTARDRRGSGSDSPNGRSREAIGERRWRRVAGARPLPCCAQAQAPQASAQTSAPGDSAGPAPFTHVAGRLQPACRPVTGARIPGMRTARGPKSLRKKGISAACSLTLVSPVGREVKESSHPFGCAQDKLLSRVRNAYISIGPKPSFFRTLLKPAIAPYPISAKARTGRVARACPEVPAIALAPPPGGGSLRRTKQSRPEVAHGEGLRSPGAPIRWRPDDRFLGSVSI